MLFRPPYNGANRKLVLALDIGTTFSGISYCILDPGQVPEIKGVTRFPAQERVGGDSKIPSILYYDTNGDVKAAGAKAVQEGLEEQIQNEGWLKAEWFKLHLRPKSTEVENAPHEIPPLPSTKSAADVFGDFMRYLYSCAKIYIEETHGNGDELWKSLKDTTVFVISHPNGWEGAQQDQLRKAAVIGGLIQDTANDHARIHFVTEGEASLHFCIQNGLTTEPIEKGQGILIIDAGGGTIDLSAYGKGASNNDHSFEEVCSPQCLFHGSIFVTENVKQFLQVRLRGSPYIEDIDHIATRFDRSTKLRFRNSNEPQFIKFGTARDNELRLDIRSGQMKISGLDVASFFKRSIDSIIQAVIHQRATALKEITSIFLVGGFAASDWLFNQLKENLESKSSGLKLCRPDNHVNKAVADGAVSFFIDHFVTSRVSRYSYGISCTQYYNPSDAEHVRRSNSKIFDAAGYEHLPGAYSVILPKDTQVSETTEFRKPYVRLMRDPSELGKQMRDDILCYRGISASPSWMNVDANMYSVLCAVVTDTSELKHIFQKKISIMTKDYYYEIAYDIVLAFGLTELTAQVCWRDKDGVEKRSPAKIVYDSE